MRRRSPGASCALSITPCRRRNCPTIPATDQDPVRKGPVTGRLPRVGPGGIGDGRIGLLSDARGRRVAPSARRAGPSQARCTAPVNRQTKSAHQWQTRGVANDDIDRYLAEVGEPKRSTLAQLRRSIHAALPDAEECMSYGMPAFKVHGKTIAGFAAFKEHLAYLPHSGSTLSSLADDLAKHERTKSSLHFPIDEPLPQVLVNALVTTRLRELGL